MPFYGTAANPVPILPSGDPSGAADLARINNVIGNGSSAQLNGSYSINGALLPASGSSLLGSGIGPTTVTQKSTTANGITASSSSPVTNVTVSGLTLAGPGSGSGVGISAIANGGAARVERLALANVVVTGFGSDGAAVTNAIMSRCDQCKFIANGGRGLYLNQGTTWRVSNTWFTGNPNAQGFLANQVISSPLLGCGSDSNAIGYEFDSCATMQMIGCDVASTAAGSSGLDGSSIKVNGCTGVLIAGSFIASNAAVGLYVTGASAGIVAYGIIETGAVGATASIKTDPGNDLILGGVNTATAPSYALGTISLLAGSFSFFSAIEAGTIQADALVTLNGGSKTSGSAPILTAVAGTSGGAAVQLVDVTRDYMVYIEIGTAGTAFTMSMGHTSAGTDVTLHASGTAVSGDVLSFLLPAGWFFKWAATTATLAQSVAVGC
jgi:hypothetical protein